MPTYRLTQDADYDFEQIFEYGLDNFGVERAIKYQWTLKERFDELAENPLLYQSVKHLRAGYRRSVCGVHTIYYRLTDEGVEIVRILGRQDVTRNLP